METGSVKSGKSIVKDDDFSRLSGEENVPIFCRWFALLLLFGLLFELLVSWLYIRKEDDALVF